MARGTITMDKRDVAGGSRQVRRLRRGGNVPGIIYRRGGSLPIQVDALELNALLRQSPTIVDITIGDDKYHSVIKDVQVHPVRETVEHIDLQAVELDEEVRVQVPVVTVGEPAGVKAGRGVLAQMMRELSVSARPGDIPDHIEADVTALDVGESLHLTDLEIPAGVTVLVDNPEEAVIAAVNAVRLRLAAATEGEGEGEAAEGDGEAAEGAEASGGDDDAGE